MAFYKFILKLISYPILALVYFYKYAISPLTPPSCRHVPTCSNYMIEAIKIHGPFKGFWMGLRRLSKCHPWGTHGYDPVPPRKIKTQTDQAEKKTDQA
ncbi:membrane protein insertion efficiency factor YidD [Roseimarinus sediminis]|uniref:membrane protein insertion efficiency factor YidD n=1 Tax=Roseimarinus sediminis TaxID=1610899 RepID=UPI003D1B29D4